MATVMATVRILTASSCQDLRERLRSALIRDVDIQIVGEAANRCLTLRALRACPTDVLLLDAELRPGDCLETLHRVQKTSPWTLTLVFGSGFSDPFIGDALQQGARGFLPANVSSETLIKAIRLVETDEIWLGRKRLAHVLLTLHRRIALLDQHPEEALEDLTERESEIVHLAAQGMTNKEIAKYLNISDKTIKAHLCHIFQKLGIHRRSQLVAYQLAHPYQGAVRQALGNRSPSRSH